MTVKTHEQATLDAALGAQRAGEHADRVEPDWRERAVGKVAKYSRWDLRVTARGESFLTEDVRQWAERDPGFPPPPDSRAWGAVMREAQRRGLIESCGYAPARSSNHSPKVLWQKAVS